MPSSLFLQVIEGRAAVPVAAGVPGDAEFASMVKARRRELHKLTNLFAEGTIDLAQWYDQSVAVLLEGHTRAAYFGRMLALQADVESELVDALAGQAATDAEEYYLRGFAEALLDKDPRYWDADAEKWITDTIQDRQDLYLGKMRGTANGAFLRESVGFYFDWMLGGTEDHCSECPDYAAGSPWAVNELPTHPGNNDTPCRFNCLCFLRREDDVYGFRRLDF